MKKILTKKTLTVASVITILTLSGLWVLGIFSFSAIGPENVRGLKITGSSLDADLRYYEFINIIVDTSNNPDTLKVYGINGGVLTEITSHFEPTTTYSGLMFNLRPLITKGKGGVMPNPAVDYYYLIPEEVRWWDTKRYLRLNVSDRSSPGSLKLFNPSPPYQPGS